MQKKIKLPMHRLIAPVIGTLACILVICIFGNDAGQSLSLLFTGTFTSPYYFGSMLNSASLLMTAGLGASVAIKSGNMNLGGEGQVYLGGFLAGLILSQDMKIPAPIQFMLALFAVTLSGALMASISAFLKEFRGAEVLLTTFLVSSASLPLIDAAITGLKGSGSQNLLALPYIKDCFKFHQMLPPSPLNGGFIASIAFCIAAGFIFSRTSAGRKMTVWGKAPLFATYSGLSSKAASYMSLCTSGALHSLTGMLAVCGTYFTCHNGFYSGMGWNALNVALMASSNPFALIPSSLFLSWLYTSAKRVSLTQGFGFDISGIIQGCILFSVAINFAAGKIRNAKSSGRKS